MFFKFLGICAVLFFLIGTSCKPRTYNNSGIKTDESSSNVDAKNTMKLTPDNCTYDTLVDKASYDSDVDKMGKEIDRELYLICTPQGELENFILKNNIVSLNPKEYIITKTKSTAWTKPTSKPGKDNLLIYYTDKEKPIVNMRNFLWRGDYSITVAQF